MAHKGKEDSASPERRAIQEARATAKLIIDEKMRQGTLRTFQQILLERDSGEQHRFSSVVEWAVKLIGEDPILDHLAVSRISLRQWIEGTITPGPLARASIIDRLGQLVTNRLT